MDPPLRARSGSPPATSPATSTSATRSASPRWNEGGQLNLLVAPLCSPVDAGDEARAVHAPEVAVRERVPPLRLVRRTLGEPEVPGRIGVPVVPLEVVVLGRGVGLDLPP